MSYTFTPVPPLVKEAFFIVQASDLDSGENKKITFIPQRIGEWLVNKILIKSDKIDQGWCASCFFLSRHEISRTSYGINTTVWVNTTQHTTWFYRIYAVDNGNPRRGDFIPVNVTINATCTSHADFMINSTTGEVFLRAPGLTISESRKLVSHM